MPVCDVSTLCADLRHPDVAEVKAGKRSRPSKDADKQHAGKGKRASSTAKQKASTVASKGPPRPRGRPPKAKTRAAGSGPPKKRRAKGKASVTPSYVSSGESDVRDDDGVLSTDSDGAGGTIGFKGDAAAFNSAIESLEAALEGGAPAGSLRASAAEPPRPQVPSGYVKWTPGLKVHTIADADDCLYLEAPVPGEVPGLECALCHIMHRVLCTQQSAHHALVCCVYRKSPAQANASWHVSSQTNVTDVVPAGRSSPTPNWP